MSRSDTDATLPCRNSRCTSSFHLTSCPAGRERGLLLIRIPLRGHRRLDRRIHPAHLLPVRVTLSTAEKRRRGRDIRHPAALRSRTSPKIIYGSTPGRPHSSTTKVCAQIVRRVPLRSTRRCPRSWSPVQAYTFFGRMCCSCSVFKHVPLLVLHNVGFLTSNRLAF